MSTDNEILTPRMPGELTVAYKHRRFMAVADYVRKFYLEHGHSDIPKGVATAKGTDVRHLWDSIRGAYANDTVTDEVRAVLEELAACGVNIEKTSPDRRGLRENLAPPEQQRLTPYLQAIAAFAERHGHTNIPDHVVSRVGELRYGVTANAWRRAHAAGTLNSWLTKKLEEIPGWTWTISEKPRFQGKVVLPDDTTQMRRSGLRQFLPEG